MAVPKKKTSRSRRDKRRGSHAHQLDAVTATTCPQCNEPVRPHRICHCGFYQGKERIAQPEAPVAQ